MIDVLAHLHPGELLWCVGCGWQDDYFKSDKKVTKDNSKKEEYLEPEDPVPHPKKGDKDSKKSEDSKKSDGWKDEDWGERGAP